MRLHPCSAGLVARMLASTPGMTPVQLKTVLHDLADNVLDGT